MKSLTSLSMLLLAVFLAVGTAGCKKSPKNVTTIEGRRDISPRPENLNGLKGNTDGRNGVNSGTPFNGNDNVKIGNANLDPSGLASRPNPDDVTEDPLILASQTVSFEYDKSSVKSSERSKVEAAAAYLKNEPRFLLKVEGHCDERGTDEYNRALGERRALSIREYLLTLGVSADRVTTISYGKDRPAVQGHDEAAYSQNRRGAFVVLKPKQ
ncbi:MAG: peptidoglycan-associated lipoprotein Pal [Pedosphaera sp.]|nr:peptidoglycan-associated lipoprotein Pal [Pedosphaera sp.]